jgi:hypothetical protein
MAMRLTLVVAAILAWGIAGCTAYVGDRVLDLPNDTAAIDPEQAISRAMSAVSALLDGLPMSKERKETFAGISPRRAIRADTPLEFGLVERKIILAKADVDITASMNSIVVTMGAVRVAHSENSIIVSAEDVTISHDGSRGCGSLVVSRGRTRISHARNTLIYATGGVVVSWANNIHAFNAPDRRTSWGYIDNTIIEPLFRNELAAKASPTPGRALRDQFVSKCP